MYMKIEVIKNENKMPNSKTLQAMKNIEEGKDLSRKFHNVQELMWNLEKDDNNDVEFYKEVLKRETTPQKDHSEEEVIKKFGIDKVNPDDSQVKIE